MGLSGAAYPRLGYHAGIAIIGQMVSELPGKAGTFAASPTVSEVFRGRPALIGPGKY